MNDGSPGTVPAHEPLARFIFFRHHIRPDQTARPDAFVPYPGRALSVVRHSDLGEYGLWRVGKLIEKSRQRELLGRVDVKAAVFIAHRLSVVSAPVPDIPTHAEVIGWPAEKAHQKSIAQRVAAETGAAVKVPPEMLNPRAASPS